MKNIFYLKDHTHLKLLHDFIKENDVFGLDTEINMTTDTLLLVQIGNNSSQFVLDCRYIDILEFKYFLESEEKLKILHNAKFDYKVFYKEGIKLNNFHDTMVAEQLIHGSREDFGYSLNDTLQRNTGISLIKPVRDEFKNIINAEIPDYLIEYAAKDVEHIVELYCIQKQNLIHSDLVNVNNLENEVVKVLALMELTGIKLDKNKWLLIKELTNNKLKEIENDIFKLVKEYASVNNKFYNFIKDDKLFLNLSSPKQKLELLKLLDNRISSTNEKTLNKYKDIDIVKLFIEYNKIKKLNSSYGDKMLSFINKRTGRIHPNYWQILSTGRMSCNNPNIQQIPSRDIYWSPLFRDSFVAEKGYLLVGADYSAFELRILAELSNDELWIDIFNKDKDLHSELCAKTFNIPIEDVKKESHFKAGLRYRDIQKTINYGLAYGMSPIKLAETTDTEVSVAEKIINDFFSLVPKVHNFLKACGSYALNKGYIRTAKPFSRKRVFSKWPVDNRREAGDIQRAAMNMPMQGTNADIIKLALVLIQKEIDKHNYPVRIIMAVHDEIVCEVKEEFVDTWKHIQMNLMVDAGKAVLKKVPVVCDVKVGKSWKEIH